MKMNIAQASAPSERSDWTLVALVFVTGLFAAAQFGKISLTLAPLAELYGTDIAGVSFFVSLVGFLGIFLGVISGAVVARAGPTRVFIWSAGIAAIISILQALLPPFAGMIVLRLLEGLTHLGIVVAGPTLMAAVTNDRDRPIAMSLWAMFFGASFAAVALVVPPLMQAGGVGLVFSAHGLGFAVICAVLIWRLPVVSATPGKIAFWGTHVAIYSSPPVMAPALAFGAYTFIYLAIITFFPVTLERPELFQIIPLISLVATFTTGWVARRVAPYTLAAVGYVWIILAGLVVWSGAGWMIYLLAFGLGIVPAACFAAIPSLNPSASDRSRAAGALSQMGNIGTTLGTPVFAFTMLSAGMSGLWVVIMGACAVGLGLIYWMTAKIVAPQN